MLSVLVLGFLVNVQATPNSHVTRALTPKYLEVDGFKDCLIDMVKPGGQANVEYCFPLSQPAGCPNNVWQEIGEAYKGKSRNKRSPQAPPSAPQPNQCTATKNGIRKNCIFPFRFKQTDFYECTKFESDPRTGAKAWCSTEVSSGDGITALSGSYVDCDPGCSGGSRPTSRPTQRTTGRPGSSTVQLVDGGKPEVFYDNRWRPICGHYFWDNNNGADLFCQQLNLGYLSGTTSKAAEYYLDSDALQIGRCRNGDSWLNCYGGCNSLQVGGLCTDGLVDGKCGRGGLAGIKITCLRNRREKSKPRQASVVLGVNKAGEPYKDFAFVNRNNKWVPICGHYFWNNNIGARLFCQKLGGTDGSIISGKYEVTLPDDGLQVGECESGDSWLQCTGGCNSLNIGGQCDQYSGGCKKGNNAGVKIRCTGVPRTKRSLPPAYINEIGHDQCLEKHSPPGANHTEYCLPATKPNDCSDLSWDEIQNSFDGEVCPLNDPSIIGGIIGLPPAHLSVRGHQKCLKEHYSAGESHTELCLPESRPNKCGKRAYKKLVEQIFL